MSAFEQQIGRLIYDPDWFPSQLDLDEGSIHFCQMSKETYASSTWLDERKNTIDGMYHKMHFSQVSQMLRQANVPIPRTNYIFHTSHCGSTLLARCLDELDGCFALKEPLLYRQLSMMRRDNKINVMVSNGQWQMLLDDCMKLLGRTFRDSEVPLIKATSICHNIMGETLRQNTASRALFLYADLADFMVSIYKDKKRVEIYLKGYYPMLIHDLLLDGIVDQEQADGLTQPQQIAVMWLARMRAYNNAIEQLPDKQLVALEFKRFLQDPERYLGEIAKHFSYPVGDSEIEEICSSGPMVKYSKQSGEAWSAGEAKAEQEEIYNRFKGEIAEGTSWVESVSPDVLIDEMSNNIGHMVS